MLAPSKPAVVITVVCLSGGSGKTTTALNLATMLADQGKTLAVDFDPQGNLSQWLGYSDLSESATVAETLLTGADRVSMSEIIASPLNEDRQGRLQLAPSDYSLSRAIDAIALEPGRELFLRRAIKPVLSSYDYVVIDSPPSKGILTYNAILAADLIVVPTECTQKGVMGALSTMVLLQELAELDFNVPELIGVIPTRDQWVGSRRTRMSKAALEALDELLQGVTIFPTLKQSTLVQQTNNMGWSLSEAGEHDLAHPYQEVLGAILSKERCHA